MSTEGRVLLQVKDVSVSFGRQDVLREISVEIRAGQTVALIGESGCGKSVFTKCLIGLIRPTHGRIVFDGDDLASAGPKEIAQLRTRYGYVFQQAALFDSMTIAQNVAFPLKQHSDKSEDEIEKSVIARLAEVGLSKSVLSKKPAELSGGMRKRVGLARALMLDPEVMLYDEPTTGLDPIMSDVINELMLKTSKSRPVTSLIVTHDMRTVHKVSNRVIMLYPLARLKTKEKQILFDGRPEDLERCKDERVRQFVNGEAGQRIMELAEQAAG